MTTAAELKQQLAELAKKRHLIEEETSAATARLNATGMGMDTPLVDREGYPRADVDIAAIRLDRQKVKMLSNDHKELSSQMEILLHRLHAISKQEGTVPTTATPSPSSYTSYDNQGQYMVDARPITAPIAVPSHSNAPFAEIDEIQTESPAARAGLRLRDQMIRFGHITGQTPAPMQAIASLLASSEGKKIETVVLRREGGEDGGVGAAAGASLVTLRLTPQKWEGRGLLGCHLQPFRA